MMGNDTEHLIIAGKSVQLFPSERENAPLVLLHTVGTEGEGVYQTARHRTDRDFSFAAIGNIDWDDEMSPWAIPPISKNDTPCTGGADVYLSKLTNDILPEILKRLIGEPEYIALTGYSLAGLFAVYAMYHTNLFSRIASASGSFWYPDFLSYVKNRDLKEPLQRIYFSLGDKEAKTHNKIFQSVADNTLWLENWYRSMNIKTIFEMNTGNHFKNTKERMAKGIAWVINDDNEPSK